MRSQEFIHTFYRSRYRVWRHQPESIFRIFSFIAMSRGAFGPFSIHIVSFFAVQGAISDELAAMLADAGIGFVQRFDELVKNPKPEARMKLIFVTSEDPERAAQIFEGRIFLPYERPPMLPVRQAA